VAAVHAGAIPLTGGRFALILEGSQPSFAGSTRNGVVSQPYNNGGPSSFRISAFDAATSASADALTGLVAEADAQGRVSLRWRLLPVATYLAMRWKVGDANCCNLASPPGVPKLSEKRDQLTGTSGGVRNVSAARPPSLV
jgi:hypothetical protein